VTRKLNVVICDDDSSRVVDWAIEIRELLGDLVEVNALGPLKFATALAALKLRRVTGTSPISDEANIFDGADVLILDSDLSPDPDAPDVDDPEGLIRLHLASEMGGEVAHLARVFTTAGAIVVINEGTQQPTFDLTLVGRNDGVADAYVSEEDIANPGLWSGSGPANGFRPWSWPRLDRLPSTIEHCVSSVSLDQPCLEALGIETSEAVECLLEGQIESLGLASGSEVASMTLKDFARNRTFGLRNKEATTDENLLRVAVCGLRRWTERVLLPAQNLLISMPQLLQHNPWLLEDRDNPASWNNKDGRWWPELPPIASQAHNTIASEFLGRNVWNVHELESRPAGERLSSADLVFCEDVSEFRGISEAADFVSDIEGPFARRFVASLEDVEYMPRNRLAR